MRWLIIIIIFSSCASKSYVYKARITHPVTSNELRYENDTFSIDYSLSPKQIDFTIYNKSTDGIRINWDEISFSVNGQTFRAIHKMTGVANVNEVQPSTTIPPKSNLEDFLLPRDKMIFFKSIYSGQTYAFSSNIFPVSDEGNKKLKNYIKNLKGVRLTIFFPFYIRNQYFSYYYDIIIDDVIEKKRK